MLNFCKNLFIWEMINFKVGLLMRLLEHGTISDKLMHVHIAFSNYLLTFWIFTGQDQFGTYMGDDEYHSIFLRCG